MNQGKKIFIFSSSRADYGILENIIIELVKKKKYQVYLGLTKSHFSKKFGYISSKYKKILKDKVIIFNKLKLSDDKVDTLLFNISSIFNEIRKIIKKNNFQKIIVLGDRYELLGACLPFFFAKTPIIHIHGGEETYGSYDNQIRKIISLMSSLHFVSHSNYKNNLINILQKKKNIYNYGSLAVENIESIKKFKSKKKIEKKFKIKFSQKNIFVSIHPETNLLAYHKKKINIFFKFLEKTKNFNIFFSSPGHDVGSQYIIHKIKKFTDKNYNAFYIKSFGKEYYFSVLKNCDCLIGNSSSGIIEAASLKIPVINLGDRQKGRIQSSNIVNSSYNDSNIMKKLNHIMSDNFQNSLKKVKNVYYRKNTKKKILQKIINS
tara:strand:+ start:1314 stop:2441 length:1128 start_codon:yes stop_codon:yes gene_type:complete